MWWTTSFTCSTEPHRDARDHATASRGTTWRRRIRRAIVINAACYLALLLLIALGCSDRLILYPSADPIVVPDIRRERIPLPNGSHVEAWVTATEALRRSGGEPEAYVLAFIGNAARAELTAPYFAKDWGDRRVEVWAVNYPGYGGSPGAARLAAIPPAALAAYDALRSRAGPGRPIFLEARSIGTAAALHVAANRPDVAGCILHNPPPLRRLINGRFGWWNLWLLAGPVAMTIPDELNSVENGRRSTCPAVFVLAGRDEVVPLKYQRLVADAYAGETRVIDVPNATHVDRVGGAELEQLDNAIDWLWREHADRGGGVAGTP